MALTCRAWSCHSKSRTLLDNVTTLLLLYMVDSTQFGVHRGTAGTHGVSMLIYDGLFPAALENMRLPVSLILPFSNLLVLLKVSFFPLKFSCCTTGQSPS